MMVRYGRYRDMPEFVNPWDVDEVHSISNDVAIILAALED
jgi:hypothetical protein